MNCEAVAHAANCRVRLLASVVAAEVADKAADCHPLITAVRHDLDHSQDDAFARDRHPRRPGALATPRPAHGEATSRRGPAACAKDTPICVHVRNSGTPGPRGGAQTGPQVMRFGCRRLRHHHNDRSQPDGPRSRRYPVPAAHSGTPRSGRRPRRPPAAPRSTGWPGPENSSASACERPLRRQNPQVTGPGRASPVPAATIGTFRGPYAGESFAAAPPGSSPLPWPSP